MRVLEELDRHRAARKEPGHGLGKVQALELEHPDLLPYYRGIKQLFDPNPTSWRTCQEVGSGRVDDQEANQVFGVN
jgi:hypothetical protein